MENTTIDWASLPFAYHKSDYNVRCHFRNGEWGRVEISSSENIEMHMASTALHYGQQAFEGLKAFTGKDGKVRLFRARENAKRMIRSADGILMAAPPEDLFLKMVFKAVKLNNKRQLICIKNKLLCKKVSYQMN